MRKSLIGLYLLAFLLIGLAFGAADDISRLYNFTSGTTIQSSQVNGEFNQLITTMNNKFGRGVANTVTGNNTFSGDNTFSGTNTFSHATTPIKTDVVAEYTAAAGVTIDSVRLKDGMVKVAGTPASGGEIGYASSALKYHNGTSVITVPDTATVSAVASISSDPVASAADKGKYYFATSTFTFTMESGSTIGAEWFCWLRNDGTGIITVDPASTNQIDGSTTITIYPGEAIMIVRVGSSNFKTIGRRKGWIALTSATASSSSTLDFASYINSDFTAFRFDIANLVPASDATTLYMRFSTNAGSSYLAGASDYAWAAFHNDGGTTNVGADTADSEIELNLAGSTLGTGTGENYNGTVVLYNPANATVYKSIRASSTIYSSAPASGMLDISGQYVGATTAVNGVRFLMSSGNIASGKITMYGYRE